MIDVATERRIVELLEAGVAAEEVAAAAGVHPETVLLRRRELQENISGFLPSVRSAAGEIRRNWTEKKRQKQIVQGKTRLGIKVVKVPKELRAYAFCEGDLP